MAIFAKKVVKSGVYGSSNAFFSWIQGLSDSDPSNKADCRVERDNAHSAPKGVNF